ncbi:hypothetical protein O181_012742 [Austropuccinia psidii MF-1]|uniref:Glycoside hydrolase 131 catalytic N-terminal domain-containing protein n=1 Tax=Austropuccinia psidii MF-1 TaxID=1389203 RepID=A0A9Q3BY99_9BASI|nr:hypothetical protein [Austropuccinia psidii MF-1]
MPQSTVRHWTPDKAKLDPDPRGRAVRRCLLSLEALRHEAAFGWWKAWRPLGLPKRDRWRNPIQPLLLAVGSGASVAGTTCLAIDPHWAFHIACLLRLVQDYKSNLFPGAGEFLIMETINYSQARFCLLLWTFFVTPSLGKIVVDYRIPASAKVSDFDDPSSALAKNTKFKAIGSNKVDEVVEFEKQPKAPFSSIVFKITDKSIFQPNEKDNSSAQLGFRRTDLLPLYNAPEVEVGKKTYHHSFKLAKPLNISHGYLLGSLEFVAGDGAHMFDIFYGSDFESKETSGKPVPNEQVASSFRVRDINFNPIYSVKAELKTVYNFAIEVDWTKQTLQVFFSTDNNPLVKVGNPAPSIPKNPKAAGSTGKNEWHLQLIKMPIPDPKDPEDKRGDVPHKGLQPPITDEEIVQLRNFVEDTTNEAPNPNPDGDSSGVKRQGKACRKTKRNRGNGSADGSRGNTVGGNDDK